MIGSSSQNHSLLNAIEILIAYTTNRPPVVPLLHDIIFGDRAVIGGRIVELLRYERERLSVELSLRDLSLLREVAHAVEHAFDALDTASYELDRGTTSAMVMYLDEEPVSADSTSVLNLSSDEFLVLTGIVFTADQCFDSLNAAHLNEEDVKALAVALSELQQAILMLIG